MENSSYCILVAESDAIIRFGFTEALSERGYCVLQAQDRADALRVASVYGGLIHALVTDVHMPELDGHALGRELRLKRPDMQILIVSTQSAAEFPLPLSHDAVLEKPVSPYVVASVVNRLVLAHSNLTMPN